MKVLSIVFLAVFALCALFASSARAITAEDLINQYLAGTQFEGIIDGLTEVKTLLTMDLTQTQAVITALQKIVDDNKSDPSQFIEALEEALSYVKLDGSTVSGINDARFAEAKALTLRAIKNSELISQLQALADANSNLAFTDMTLDDALAKLEEIESSATDPLKTAIADYKKVVTSTASTVSVDINKDGVMSVIEVKIALAEASTNAASLDTTNTVDPGTSSASTLTASVAMVAVVAAAAFL